MPDERRAHRRHALRVPVALYRHAGKDATQASLFDVSEGGAFFTMTSPPAPGANAEFRLTTAAGVQSEATGYVLRTMPFGGAPGVAVHFGHISPTFRDFLQRIDASPDASRETAFGDLTGVEIFVG
mgnify:FL=1